MIRRQLAEWEPSRPIPIKLTFLPNTTPLNRDRSAHHKKSCATWLLLRIIRWLDSQTYPKKEKQFWRLIDKISDKWWQVSFLIWYAHSNQLGLTPNVPVYDFSFISIFYEKYYLTRHAAILLLIDADRHSPVARNFHIIYSGKTFDGSQKNVL